LVSQDFQTTAIVINLLDDIKHRELIETIESLQAKIAQESTNQLRQELAEAQDELKIHRDKQRRLTLKLLLIFETY